MTSANTEYEYTPVEGSLTIDNKLEIEEDGKNAEKNTPDTDTEMTVERFNISEGSDNCNDNNTVSANTSKTFLYIAACIGEFDIYLIFAPFV